MSPGAWCWLIAALLYLAFRLWYDNWRGPLRSSEITHFMGLLAMVPGSGGTDFERLRLFLERDDGREFLMLNMVRLSMHPMRHPKTGEATHAQPMLQQYLSRFSKIMLRYAGHPVLGARKIGPYVDSWQVPADPGWSIAAFMRYRSRRDMMRLCTHPAFVDAHPFKQLAIDQTFSFPCQAVMQMVLGPRLAVALLLVLTAALAHLALSA